MSVSSRSAIVGLLVLAGRRLTAAELIRLAAPLGLTPTNVKSHLTRMVAEGALEREGSARLSSYGPSDAQRLIIDGIHARLTPVEEPWDGAWIMLALRLPRDRGQRERLRGSMWFNGWRPAAPDLVLRPAWPAAWTDASARQYADYAHGFALRGTFLSAPVKPQSLYDLDGLDSAARRLTAWIGRRIVPPKSPRAAFVERMQVGGRMAQFIGHDPRLPPAVWAPRRGIEQLVASYRRFEECIAPEAQRFLDQVIHP
jgi:phenylacetic acid degradation operon negative regulatory protein